MRKGSYVLGLTLMGVLALCCSPSSAQPYSQHNSGAQVDVGIFYDSLAPYGDWVEIPDYGWSWAPRVEDDWRPYTRGQWIMTDDGWFWDSDEQFGWATYHYGRWLNDPDYGWVWIPGTEWAPAWVSWRHGNGYTGWAPLPPRATWQTRVGLSIGGLDIDAFIGADDYAFVQDRNFVDRGVYQRFLPRTQNLTIIHATNNVTHYSNANNRVFNGGIAIANVERAVGRSVPRARTVDVSRADAPRSAVAGQVTVFRPQVRVAPEKRPAQGKSLVKGEAPPPLLVERRNVRAQERQQKGNQLAVTAKAVQTQPPAAPQNAVGQGAKVQAQQKVDAEAQAAQRAKDAQLAHDQAQSHQQQLDQQRAKQQSDAQAQQNAAAQAQAAKHAKDGQQQAHPKASPTPAPAEHKP
jgi:hypothetical protein